MRYRSKISLEDDLLLVHTNKGDLLFNILPKFNIAQEEVIKGGLVAPMPGKVVEIKVKKGSNIKKGDTLVILEAMKMQNEIQAPVTGKVTSVNCEEGQAIEANIPLVIIEHAPETE